MSITGPALEDTYRTATGRSGSSRSGNGSTSYQGPNSESQLRADEGEDCVIASHLADVGSKGAGRAALVVVDDVEDVVEAGGNASSSGEATSMLSWASSICRRTA